MKNQLFLVSYECIIEKKIIKILASCKKYFIEFALCTRASG